MNVQQDIPFHPITLSDQEWYREILSDVRITACDHSFSSNFVWKDTYQVEVALLAGCLIIKYAVADDVWFTYPISSSGENRRRAVTALEDYCRREHLELRFTVITREQKEEIEAQYPNRFVLIAFRDGYDYVYERKRLAELKGKKLSAKRNHIHRFREGAPWAYEELNPANLQECSRLEDGWLEHQADPDEDMEEERRALRTAIQNYEELGLQGGLIRRNGEVVAFCIGEALNSDTFVVFFEKARADIQGAYQIINQQFALHHPEYTYINREDDMGDPGIRKSKLSYYPDEMVEKYMAVEYPVSFVHRSDWDEITDLWAQCFGDSPGYIIFYLEHMFEEHQVLCIRKEGKIVSMASFLPATLCDGTEEKSIRYVYAVATLPEYRRQGMAAFLLSHGYRVFGCPLLLSPANESLISYYEKLGFQKLFTEEKQVILCEPKERKCSSEVYCPTRIDDTLAKQYAHQRAQKYGNIPHVEWDLRHIRYALEECLFSGGAIAVFPEGMVLFEAENGSLYVTESTIPQNVEEQCLSELAGQYHANEIEICRFPGMILDSENSFALTEKSHFALTLG